jgi:hypothetical protein
VQAPSVPIGDRSRTYSEPIPRSAAWAEPAASCHLGSTPRVVRSRAAVAKELPAALFERVSTIRIRNDRRAARPHRRHRRGRQRRSGRDPDPVVRNAAAITIKLPTPFGVHEAVRGNDCSWRNHEGAGAGAGVMTTGRESTSEPRCSCTRSLPARPGVPASPTSLERRECSCALPPALGRHALGHWLASARSGHLLCHEDGSGRLERRRRDCAVLEEGAAADRRGPGQDRVRSARAFLPVGRNWTGGGRHGATGLRSATRRNGALADERDGVLKGCENGRQGGR